MIQIYRYPKTLEDQSMCGCDRGKENTEQRDSLLSSEFKSIETQTELADSRSTTQGEDLDQAIALQREALALHPVDHTYYRSSSLNNLATHLSTRFYHRGNAEDLDQAIALARDALAL
jgi:hypothetical protein